MDEFVEDFISDGSLTPIEEVSDVTGLSLEEIRNKFLTFSLSIIYDPNLPNDITYNNPNIS